MIRYIVNGNPIDVKPEDIARFEAINPGAERMNMFQRTTEPNPASDTFGLLEKLQMLKDTPLPGIAGAGKDKAITALQAGVGFFDSVFNEKNEALKNKETDPYKDNAFLDFTHDMYRYAAKDFTDTKRAEALLNIQSAISKGKKYDDEDIAKIFEIGRKVEEIGLPDEAKAYQEIYEKNKEKYGGFTAFFQALGENPTFAIGTTVGSSARFFGQAVNSPTTLRRSLAGGTAAGLTAFAAGPAAPVSVPTAFASGFFGTLSGNLEQATTFQEIVSEQLRLEGKDFTIENMKSFLDDDEVITFKSPRGKAFDIVGTRAQIARKRAFKRGVTIGFVDTAIGLIGGKVVGGMVGRGATKKAIGLTSSAFGIGGGIASETAGMIAGGQELETGDILLEGLAEKALALTGVTSIPAVVKGKKTYELNGQEVSEKTLLKELYNMSDVEVAEILDKIKITNDNFTKNRILQRAESGRYQSEISPEVTNIDDRKKLAELQMKLDNFERQNKSKSIFKSPGLQNKIDETQKQINDILDTYATQPQVSPETSQAFKDSAAKIRAARNKFLTDEITEKVKKSKIYKNRDIDTKNLTAQESVDLFIKNEAANLGYDLTLLNEKLTTTKDAKTRREIKRKIKEVQGEINALEQNAEEARTSHGFLLEDNATGKMTIVINDDVALSDGANINVAAHELLHAILRNTFLTEKGLRAREVKGVGLQTGQKLMDYLVENNELELLVGGDILARLKRYGEKNEDGTYSYSDVAGQEILNLLSDAFVNTNYSTNFESFLLELGQRISDIIQAYVPEKYANKLNFADGKQVFDFIKTFNKAVRGDKIAERIIERTTRKGIDVKPEAQQETQATKPQMSKQASDNVQRIYEEKGAVNGSFEIIQEFKPITNRLALRYKDVPGYNRELLVDEIETGKRGIYDLIQEYNPNSGVPLAAYINKFLPARAIEAANRVLDTEFKQDVTERVDIAAEETTTEVKAKPKPKKIVLADRLGIGEKVNEAIKKIIPTLEVKDLTFKSLKNKIPEVVGDLFGIAAKKLITNANITKGELQSSQMFISKNADLLINMLPEGATASGTATGIPNSLLKAFYTKTGRAKMAKTGSAAGLAIQQKNKINRKQFLEVFGIVDGKPNRTDRNTSARVLALANTLGKMITNQAVRQQDLKLSNESITKLKDGKSNIMFSKQTIENVKSDKNGNFTKNSSLIDQNGKEITTVPSDKVLITKQDPETGLFVGDVVTIKQMDALWDSDRGITWQDHMSARLNVFLDRNPQYYDALQELFTGGVKRTAYMTKDIFEVAIPKTDKIKQTEQISASRLDYHRSLNQKEKEKGLKGKRLRKNIQELDTSKDKDKTKTFINLFNNIGKYLNEGQNMLDLWLMEEMLLHSSVDQNNFFRKSALLLGFPIDDNGNPIIDQVVIEEHTPINEVIKIAMGSAIRNKIKDITPLLESLLSQFSILAKDDPSGKLKSSMGIDFYNKVAPRILDGSLKLKPGHAGIYRLMKHGVNPFRYKLLESGKTIAQEFSVDNLSVDEARQKVIDYFEGNVSLEYNTQMSKVPFSKGSVKNNKLSNAIFKARTVNFSKQSKGITVLDFDDTLATTESLVKYTAPDGTTGTLNAEQFASTYQDLQDQGYTFDFSDFNRVVKGKLAPLFNKALKLQKKFGPENMFVLTARPPAAQKPIFDFLKANGLNIPLKNITGLGNSTSEAKALWIADKVAEGYNDFYFADDALQNVQAVKNMLDQFDVKSKVQQAKVQFSKGMDQSFNDILQDVTGIDSKKRYSQTKARKRGEGKGKFRFFVPPSHEDFAGLLYNFMGKGEKGNKHREFFEQALLKPLNRAYQELTAAKQAIATDYKNLIKQFPDLRKKLTKKTPDGDYYYSDAVRVYLWDKAGFEIPGTSKTDVKELSDLVKNDPELQSFADTIGKISRMDEGYIEPGEHWEAGDIRTDLADATGRVGRAKFFNEFQENADIIFNKENLNKIEAAYGPDFRAALEDILYRTKNGTNRTVGPNKIVNGFLDYLNGSIGATMFFNARSAVLQTLSTVNFINFGDNNIFKAAAAFANQPQFWKDFSMIFNSDVLKQRRAGVAFDINANEIASAVGKSKTAAGKVRAAVKYLLQIGFLPTQMADSFAISLGGASMYRNRVNTYLKQGLSQKEAEAKAFTDFQEVSEATQQSARPDMISQQQASVLGRLILAFQNTPSQYVRLIKKAGLDLINRRKSKPYTSQVKSDMSNISRIIYYGAVQNIIFGALQTALFAILFSEDDEEDQKTQKFFKTKKDRVINGTIDTILRGSGVAGAIVATVKNGLIKYHENQNKKWNKQLDTISEELIQLSPPIGIKKRKLDGFEKTLEYNKKVIPEMDTFDIDNPIWYAYAQLIEGATNIPVARLHRKVENIRAALNSENEWWQRLAVGLGWSKWDVGIENKEVEAVKEKIKEQKKKIKKSKDKNKIITRPSPQIINL